MKQNPINIKESTSYLYFLRIFAAILVILLHCIAPFLSNLYYFETRIWWICNALNCISRAAVPLFFMISGYLLLSNPKTLNIKEFYKKRIPRLLVSLIIWNILYYLYSNYQDLSVSEFFKQALHSGTSYHLWFVYSMIGFYLLLPFLKRITDNCSNKQLWLLTIILSFSSTIRPFINTTFHVYVYFSDKLANGYIIFFLLGYLLGTTKFNFKTYATVYICGILGMFMGVFGNWYFSSDEALNLIANEAYRVNHILCACAIFVFFKQIPFDKNPRLLGIAKAFSGLTFGIYLIHPMLLDFFDGFIPSFFSPVEIIGIRFISTSITSFLVIYLIGKIKGLSKLLM